MVQASRLFLTLNSNSLFNYNLKTKHTDEFPLASEVMAQKTLTDKPKKYLLPHEAFETLPIIRNDNV